MQQTEGKSARQSRLSAAVSPDEKMINYYAADGSTIAENQTYPLDMAVSPDGEIIAVAYLFVDNGDISSRIIFYNSEMKDRTKRIILWLSLHIKTQWYLS